MFLAPNPNLRNAIPVFPADCANDKLVNIKNVKNIFFIEFTIMSFRT
jgi:hypothetical protein